MSATAMPEPGDRPDYSDLTLHQQFEMQSLTRKLPRMSKDQVIELCLLFAHQSAARNNLLLSVMKERVLGE